MLYCLYRPSDVPIPIFAHRFETFNGYEVSNRSGERLEITMLEAGEYRYTMAGETFDSKIGNVTLWLPQNHLHYRVEGHHAHSTVSVPCPVLQLITEEEARETADRLPDGTFLLPLQIQGDLNEAAKLFRVIISHTHSGDPAAGMAAGGAFLQLCALLTRQCVWQLKAPGTTSAQARYCRKVIEYLAENYTKPLSLPDLATRVGLSPNYLCTLFRRTTGQTVVQYLTHYRLETARGLLLTTDLSVAAVAAAVGYDDAAYFTRQFTREMKTPPSKLRHRE